MSDKYYTTSKFLKLKDKWYKKLKDADFEDIEQDEEHLKRWCTSRFVRQRNNGASFEEVIILSQAKEQYYRQATYFLNDHKFASVTDRFIWEQHSEGISHRKISAMLAKHAIKMSRDVVLAVILKLRREMFTLLGVPNE